MVKFKLKTLLITDLKSISIGDFDVNSVLKLSAEDFFNCSKFDAFNILLTTPFSFEKELENA